MARIELRDCTFRLVDGHRNTAAVNGSPAVGDTSFDVDTLGTSGILPVTARFTVAGDTPTHTITAQKGGSVYTIAVGSASAGSFTLAVGSHSASTAIAYNALASAVKTAIVNTGVSTDDVTVTGSAPTWTITFTGSLNKVVTALVSAVSVTLTGGALVQSTVHAGGLTYNITFTPALVAAPADDAVLTVGGRTVEANIGTGNTTYTENKTYEYQLSRGNLDTVREGDQVPMDVTMDFVWDFLASIDGVDTPTIEDALKRLRAASDWVSSSADPCEPYAVDIEIQHIPNCLTVEEEITTLPDFRVEKLNHDVKAAQVTATGKCNAVYATNVRVSQ